MNGKTDLNNIFKNTVSDLMCVNWSETDGNDVRKILEAAFADRKSEKAEITLMFEKTTELNKFQKTMIQQMLDQIA